MTAGYFVFNQTPDVPTLAGALIVIASGLYLLHRERLKRVAPSGGVAEMETRDASVVSRD